MKPEEENISDAPSPWRLSLLAVDDRPHLRAFLYERWEQRGAELEVETGVVRALDRIETGRFTYVFFSLALRGRLGCSDDFMGEAVRRWAEVHAPNYRGRLLYFGSPGLLEREVPDRFRSIGEPPLFPLSQPPTPEEVQAATRKLTELLSTTPAARARDWAQAEAR